MEHFGKIASLAGALGLLTCLAASAGRFYGEKEFVGFQASSIFMVGMGLMVMACWLKLEEKSRQA